MNMKTLIKEHVPWAMRESLRSSRDFMAQRKPPFRGVYKSFDDLPKTAGYDHQDWGNRAYQNAVKAKNAIGLTAPPHLAPTKSLLPAVVSTVLPFFTGKEIRILDFGGAGGLDYGYLRALIGDRYSKLAYHVVDVPSACEGGRRAWEGDNRITFSSDLPQVNERFDLVYSFSALHCVPDYKTLCEQLAGYGAKIMLFCKHPAHEGAAFVREQVNMGPGKEVPQWVLSVPEMEKIFGDYGYTLLFRVPGENTYNVDNYPSTHRVEGVLNMIFAKI